MNTNVGSRRMPSPLVEPLNDNRRVVGLIAEVTDQPADSVRARLFEEERSLRANVCAEIDRLEIQPHVWTDRLTSFYEQTDSFIYELVAWNRRAFKLEMRRWIGDYLARAGSTPLDILTIGDGLGFDSAYLADSGHKVTYCEVGRFSVAFARRVFDSSSRRVTVLSGHEQIEPDGYDALICLDVLEHLPDPVAFVGQLAGYLRPGGRLIVHAPFFEISRSTPTHLRSNCRYSGDVNQLYRSNGLEPVDGRLFWNPLVLEKTSADGQRSCLALSKRLTLLIGSLVFRGARLWRWPYCRVGRLLTRGDPRWLEGLES